MLQSTSELAKDVPWLCDCVDVGLLFHTAHWRRWTPARACNMSQSSKYGKLLWKMAMKLCSFFLLTIFVQFIFFAVPPAISWPCMWLLCHPSHGQSNEITKYARWSWGITPNLRHMWWLFLACLTTEIWMYSLKLRWVTWLLWISRNIHLFKNDSCIMLA